MHRGKEFDNAGIVSAPRDFNIHDIHSDEISWFRGKYYELSMMTNIEIKVGKT